MKNLNRRDFLKTAALGAAAATLGTKSAKASEKLLSEDRLGVLVDTSVCVGCRHCEWACRLAHNMPSPALDYYSNPTVLKEFRRPDKTALTVVNEFENDKNPNLPIHVKIQCMHCDHPACVSACIVGALTKNEDGSVVWDDGKCIGCRYCMVACQFQIPTYDYDVSIDPHIRKCDFCTERRKEGQLPACVNICPNEALVFGKRSEILRIAKNRTKRKPDIYINHIYGESEIGGTSWVYIAGKDFNELKMPPLGKNPAPGISEAIQHGIFAYFVPPVTLYALLGTIMWVTKRRNESADKDKHDHHSDSHDHHSDSGRDPYRTSGHNTYRDSGHNTYRDSGLSTDKDTKGDNL
ncbi:MAG: 4Fe-4S dicluster domain-containing protein [Ignavibacteriae bacterium]|nr:4Fe-4S dicluster domain-containing protein [Ignavibacteriota bacterium]